MSRMDYSWTRTKKFLKVKLSLENKTIQRNHCQIASACANLNHNFHHFTNSETAPYEYLPCSRSSGPMLSLNFIAKITLSSNISESGWWNGKVDGGRNDRDKLYDGRVSVRGLLSTNMIISINRNLRNTYIEGTAWTLII